MPAITPGTRGGLAVARSLSLVATGVSVRAAEGKVFGWDLYNGGAAAVYVKLYDNASAPSSSDTPLVTIAIPAASSDRLDLPAGIGFKAGIGWRASTGVADNDNTAPAANQVVANLFYL